MHLTPDESILWQCGVVTINKTLVYSWLVIALLVIAARSATRNLSTGPVVSRRQNFLEVLVKGVKGQVEEISREPSPPYFPFIATLFLYIAVCNFLAFVPGYHPATGSLSTTAGLATCVFVAVPVYGIQKKGLLGYLKNYLEPPIFMMPFHVMGELTRTLALAVRLFGNVMSGGVTIATLLAISPFLFPILMQALELLIGQIQAYIFAVLATVYIASATRAHEEIAEKIEKKAAPTPQSPTQAQ